MNIKFLRYFWKGGLKGNIDSSKTVITKNFPMAVNVSKIPIVLIGIIIY